MSRQPSDIVEELLPSEGELKGLRGKRDDLNEEARKWAEKRDQLNEKFRGMTEEIQTLKKKRDDLNNEVKRLKGKRDEARSRIAERRKELDELKRKINSLRKQTSTSYPEAEETMQALDWKIQTTSMPAKEENKLISRIKKLEADITLHKQARDLEAKVMELRAEIGSLKIQADTIHSELSKLAEESEVYHKKMMEIVETASKVKGEADNAHKSYVDLKNRATDTHKEYMERLNRIQQIEYQTRAAEESARQKKIDEAKMKRDEIASQKLKKGQKLSFEEFRLLVEQGKV